MEDDDTKLQMESGPTIRSNDGKIYGGDLQICGIIQPMDLIIRATSHTRLKAHDHCNLRVLIGREAETVQVHVTHEGEGLKVQRRLHGWKSLYGVYVVDNG